MAAQILRTRLTRADVEVMGGASLRAGFNGLLKKTQAGLLIPLGFLGHGIEGYSFSPEALTFFSQINCGFVGDLPDTYMTYKNLVDAELKKVGGNVDALPKECRDIISHLDEAKRIWDKMFLRNGNKLSIEKPLPRISGLESWSSKGNAVMVRGSIVKLSQAVARLGVTGLSRFDDGESSKLPAVYPVYSRDFIVGELGSEFLDLNPKLLAVLVTPLGYLGQGFEDLPKIPAKTLQRLEDQGIQYTFDLINSPEANDPSVKAVLETIGFEKLLSQNVPSWKKSKRKIPSLKIRTLPSSTFKGYSLSVDEQTRMEEKYILQRVALVYVSFMGFGKSLPTGPSSPARAKGDRKRNKKRDRTRVLADFGPKNE